MGTELAETVSRNIRLAREKLGLSQEELAARAEVTTRYVSMLETRSKNVTLATVERIAAALEMTPCDLLCPGRKARQSRKDEIASVIDILKRVQKGKR